MAIQGRFSHVLRIRRQKNILQEGLVDMREMYQKKLKQLTSEVLEMGMLCGQAVVKTYQLLLTTKENRQQLIDEIVKLEREIDEKDGSVEAITVQLLLKQQPVAGDLRKITASLKLISDLERIGDQAVDIAEIIQTGSLEVPIQQLELLEMAKQAIMMVGNCITAYEEQDAKKAEDVIKNDDIMDDMFAGMHKLLNENRGEQGNAQILDMLMIAKYYERIADHATNVAEWALFSVTGIHKNGDVDYDIFGLRKE